ncbi:type III-A CRISPR-associated RAMP protein Csm3 [Facklamia hominis]
MMTNYYGKLLIQGRIRVVTGLHIGTSNAFSAIGSTDQPVVRDVISGRPLIPGSSFKGKMRSLLAKSLNESVASTPNDDNKKILRLFGDSKSIMMGRLLFRDSLLSNYEELMAKGADTVTEVKFENAIDRKTSEANPRQVERVIPQACFDFEIVYDFSSSKENYQAEILEDMAVLDQGLKLLEYDYLGGNGSRGYGKIAFEDMKVKQVVGNLSPEFCESIHLMK